VSLNIRQAALLSLKRLISAEWRANAPSAKALRCSGMSYTFLGSLVVAPKLGVIIASGVAAVRSSNDDTPKCESPWY
jgi:hypothetical protein